MRHSSSSPKVNAGSMADIAFLLLIFFLVTTTMTKDEGLNRTLPKECPPGVNCSDRIAERNLLKILINSNEDIMVNNEQLKRDELKPLIKAFIDNNGDGTCNYCSGLKDEISSDNPNKAIIFIETHRAVSYETYITIQNEITKAYYEIRLEYGLKKFNKPAIEFDKDELKMIKDAYPFKISEAATN